MSVCDHAKEVPHPRYNAFLRHALKETIPVVIHRISLIQWTFTIETPTDLMRHSRGHAILLECAFSDQRQEYPQTRLSSDRQNFASKRETRTFYGNVNTWDRGLYSFRFFVVS